MIKLFHCLFLVNIFSCPINKQVDSVVAIQTESFKRSNDAVLVRLKNSANSTHVPKFQVLSEHTTKFIASVLTPFPYSKGVMLSKSKDAHVTRKIKEINRPLTLRTDQIITPLALFTDKISFSDSVGKFILKDAKGNDSIDMPVTIDEVKACRICQKLESRINDAFCGSVQRQIGAMNYKGKGVNITQYNSLVAVPFLLSSKNYGILWDSYSILCFSDAYTYEPLSKLTLYSSEGNPEGLLATYVSSPVRGKDFIKCFGKIMS